MRVQGSASGSRRTELDALTTNRSLAMPLLPTLATAVVIASLSLLCRQPSAPEPKADVVITAAVAPSGADDFQRPGPASEQAAAVPATVAFGQLYPLSPESSAAARSSRVASAVRRVPKRAEPVRTAASPPRPQPEAAPLPFRETADQGGETLPEGALPFAPTAAAVVDSVRALGGEAATLGSSVIGSLALMR